MFNKHNACIKAVIKEISCRHRNKKIILDVGCGDGTRTLLFDAFDRLIFGVDRLDWLNKEGRERIAFTRSDFVKIPFPFAKQTFDIIFSFDVIEHLPSPEIMLQEIHRVLKNDGLFIISTPNRHRLLSFFLLILRLRKIPYSPDKNTTQTDPYAWHVTEYTFRDLEKLLKSAGFSVTKKHKIFYGITGWYGFSHFFNFPFFHNIIFECRKE